ncbi:hypothetical protein HG536_0E05170 [Torulaspora globosa]|uniref:RRM domain-containing protein n=1 Tax=Torulaspora globosa TaxID=48254 RepID=A0A7G3ZJC0_9SACH|nr:uncharacterized protein HG536_0E05170 [Torulaspora globosa]QLL33606.1 hypothetical protein HG536_0E05170 [Torulaspora globosa]
MFVEDSEGVVEWLESTLPEVSEADPELLKELLLDFLEECSLKGREAFVEAVCVLVEGIIDDSRPFAEQLYEKVCSQRVPADVGNWVAVYDLPGHLCRQKLIIREFEQFGEMCACRVCGSVSQDRRNALIKFVDRASVEACLRSSVPFFNDRFVQVDAVGRADAEEPQPVGSALGQLSTQLNVKSKQLAGYRERLREIQRRVEATNPRDSCNLKRCYSLYQEFMQEIEKKQLTPELLYRLRDKLQTLKEDPKMYVKPKNVSASKRLKT